MSINTYFEKRETTTGKGERGEGREDDGEALEVKLSWVGRWRDFSNNTYFGVI